MRQVDNIGLHLWWGQFRHGRHLLVGELVAGRPHKRRAKLVLGEFVPEWQVSQVPVIAGREDAVRVVLDCG